MYLVNKTDTNRSLDIGSGVYLVDEDDIVGGQGRATLRSRSK